MCLVQGALTGAAGDHQTLSEIAIQLAAQKSLSLLEVGLTEAQASSCTKSFCLTSLCP